MSRFGDSYLCASEGQPEAQLNAAGAVGGADDAEAGGAERTAGKTEVRVVERVEEFAPALQADAFGEVKAPNEREIHREFAVRAEDVDALVAEGEGRRLLKGVSVEPALERTGGQVRVAQGIGAKRPGGKRVGGVGAQAVSPSHSGAASSSSNAVCEDFRRLAKSPVWRLYVQVGMGAPAATPALDHSRQFSPRQVAARAEGIDVRKLGEPSSTRSPRHLTLPR